MKKNTYKRDKKLQMKMRKQPDTSGFLSYLLAEFVLFVKFL